MVASSTTAPPATGTLKTELRVETYAKLALTAIPRGPRRLAASSVGVPPATEIFMTLLSAGLGAAASVKSPHSVQKTIPAFTASPVTALSPETSVVETPPPIGIFPIVASA